MVQVLDLCDGLVAGSPTRPPVLLFLRNPQPFPTILDAYRRREIHVCERNCPLTAQEEFEYWGLGRRANRLGT